MGAGTGACRQSDEQEARHCVDFTRDGLVYICDRGNNRIQVFDASEVGQECSNPAGEIGKCGFVREVFVAAQKPSGTSGGVAFSPDPAQGCMYVPELTNNTVYITNRENFHELDRIGRTGRQIGEFVMAHGITIDPEGNLYAGGVGDSKRAQKCLRYGEDGCSGTHLPEVSHQWGANSTYR